MFFTTDHPHFFRPLTGKYREQVVACLQETGTDISIRVLRSDTF